jgi:hypothetical protein
VKNLPRRIAGDVFHTESAAMDAKNAMIDHHIVPRTSTLNSNALCVAELFSPGLDIGFTDSKIDDQASRLFAGHRL